MSGSVRFNDTAVNQNGRPYPLTPELPFKIPVTPRNGNTVLGVPKGTLWGKPVKGQPPFRQRTFSRPRAFILTGNPEENAERLSGDPIPGEPIRISRYRAAVAAARAQETAQEVEESHEVFKRNGRWYQNVCDLAGRCAAVLIPAALAALYFSQKGGKKTRRKTRKRRRV